MQALGRMPNFTRLDPGHPEIGDPHRRNAACSRDRRSPVVVIAAPAYERILVADEADPRAGYGGSRACFARVQVRTAPIRGAAARGEETLLIEWPKGEPEPTKYWLSTLHKDISFCALVDRAKMRWRVERDYLELKQEIGLGHYEGRGWPGFHHHATLCIAVYGFLISERETIPPLRTSLRLESQKTCHSR